MTVTSASRTIDTTSPPPGATLAAPPAPMTRPRVAGKFLTVGDEKLYVRGVTYGTFAPGADGSDYDPAQTERDFAQMAAQGINAVRVYTVPPRWLLDAAQRHGLRVMVGLPWEQHVAFLDGRARRRDIERRVRATVRGCAGHPAILCYAIGNEIPAPIVRWSGAAKIERFLARLYQVVKHEDPGALVTYVNFPSTEYLDLPFVDLVCFNVYLEQRDKLAAYLARLQVVAGDRPLLLAEIGLDSQRNGEQSQADQLDWQVRTTFAAGCAGAFVFAWTDEWHRGGIDIADWDFGLTRRDRSPKPALAAVRAAYAGVPFPADRAWPRISVVVCSYNGARTLRDCLDGLRQLDYLDYEVIVVDDGSTDGTSAIAGEYGVRLIRTENRGLSNARNTGWHAATGEIVAYTDDDARPDPHWLRYLADTYLTTEHACIGGPNIAPAGDGPIADCVANAPGGPIHVLLTDTVAEHLPGCNLTFRREWLERIGGFDPRFRAAGDDVDICWRLQEAGQTLGFSPAAMVWHHRRNSVRAYWRQQHGYGRAEALLEAKWPARYNAGGHVAWAGRLYGTGVTRGLDAWRGRIYQGMWGTAPFQRLYTPTTGLLAALPLTPEWHLIIAALIVLSLLGLFWPPLLVAVPLVVLAVAIPVAQAVMSARQAIYPTQPLSPTGLMKRHVLTAALHLIQPVARLRGRLKFGLTPWRHRGSGGFTVPWPRTRTVWSEQWRAPEDWLRDIVDHLRAEGALVHTGGDFDHWDIEIRGGLLGSARLLAATEEHGNGTQLIRYRVWPRCSGTGVVLAILFAALALLALLNGPWGVAVALAGFAVVHIAEMARECSSAEAMGLGAVLEQASESLERSPQHTRASNDG